jgi:hypothetical protein
MKGLFEYSLLFSSLPAVSRMQSTEGGRERGLVLADKTASRDEAGTGACGIANWWYDLDCHLQSSCLFMWLCFDWPKRNQVSFGRYAWLQIVKISQMLAALFVRLDWFFTILVMDKCTLLYAYRRSLDSTSCSHCSDVDARLGQRVVRSGGRPPQNNEDRSLKLPIYYFVSFWLENMPLITR